MHTLTLLVGEEGMKGRRMGVASAQPNLAATHLGVSSLSKSGLCSLLGKGKRVCRCQREDALWVCLFLSLAGSLSLRRFPLSTEGSGSCRLDGLLAPHTPACPNQRLPVPQNHQAHPCSRAFAHAVPAIWNACPHPSAPLCPTSSCREPSLTPSIPMSRPNRAPPS